MNKIAVVNKVNTPNNLNSYFDDLEFDYYYLTDSKEKKILKKDITLEFSFLDEYDYVILIGAEPAKFIGKVTSVIKSMGILIDNRYLVLSNPASIKYNPGNAAIIENAIAKIKNIINGTVVKADITIKLIQDEDRITELFKSLPLYEIIALDTEATCLYPRNGYVLGFSITIKDNEGYYIDADYITDDHIDILQNYANTHKIIFHNAKFDMHMLKYHFGLDFKYFEDTMLLHYCLNEQTGTHGLKELAIKYTDLGDYDTELVKYKKEYCKKNGIKISDFTYDLIPFDILGPYAAIDTIATFALYKLFKPKVTDRIGKVYDELLIAGIKALLIIEDNGVPFSEGQLQLEKHNLDTELDILQDELYTFDAIHVYEKRTGNVFNTNSVMHKRMVLFDILGLKGPGKKTGTGALSVDAEVMEFLAPQHKLPELMLKLSKLKKIKSTYIDKIIVSIDSDGRLRTNFNLHTTTSGRLSSSGKLNMQQLPRDNKAPKRCIKARNGWKIVSGDLGTAEMWCVAAMSGDPVLQGIFKNKEDYHSMIAKYKFDLPYTDKEIKEFHSDLRQAAKTTSFEILYKLNLKDPILQRFKILKKWLEARIYEIETNGYIYQFFGRKRRLPNVFSSDRQVRSHEVRSGVNSLVQGPSSDINLLACIDLVNYIKSTGMKAKVFAMVHDSILAEVPDDELVLYSKKLKEFMQKDRGLMIEGTPVGVDIEIGSSYALEDKKDFEYLLEGI